MFIPKAFKITDKGTIYDIIEEYSFATLYSNHNGKPHATHLPLTLNRTTETLHGHFARANEQWKVAANKEVLVTFHGPHCYISPSWYETNQTVPTWNYVAVHVNGLLEIVDNEEEVWILCRI